MSQRALQGRDRLGRPRNGHGEDHPSEVPRRDHAGDAPEFRVSPIELRNPQGRKRVGSRVTKLFEQVRDNHKDVFDRHETITAGEREIATVVSELQEFRFLTTPDTDEVYDVIGAAYEVYVGSHLKGDRASTSRIGSSSVCSSGWSIRTRTTSSSTPLWVRATSVESSRVIRYRSGGLAPVRPISGGPIAELTGGWFWLDNRTS